VWYSPRVRSQTGRGAFAWAMLAPSLALAQGPADVSAANGLALHWHDPSSLAATNEVDFEARLSERLGHPAFDPAADQHALAVTWQGSPEQCRVELQLLHGADVQGTRLLESPSGDCRSLLPALLTVAALLIESRPSEPEPAPKPQSRPSPPPSAEKTTEKPDPPREGPVLLSAGAAVGSGLAPKLELGPAASLVFAPARHFRVGVWGALFFPHQYGTTPGISLGHDSAALLACGMPLSGSFGLGVCGNVAFHSWSSRGISLAHPEINQTSAWTTGVALRAEWRLVRQLWWVGSIGTDVATRPLYFFFTPRAGGETVIFRQRRIAPALFLGLTLGLP
jgi:hypothetical protein